MGEKIKLDSKVGKLSDIGKLIKPGSFVAFGGGWSCNKPMAVVREIIRQKSLRRVQARRLSFIQGNHRVALSILTALCFRQT